jgi:hypothetical protein
MKIHFFDEASTDCVDRCCLVQSARNRKDGENNVVIRGETRSVFRIKRPKKTFVAHGKSHKHALDKISEKHASHNDGLINEFGVIELAIKCHFDTRAISTRVPFRHAFIKFWQRKYPRISFVPLVLSKLQLHMWSCNGFFIKITL